MLYSMKHRALYVTIDNDEHGGVMRQPRVDDRVRLTHDMPELALCRGTVGVVRSTWFAPTVAYEVEFQPVGLDFQTRALLLASQVELDDADDTMSFDERAEHTHSATA